MLADWPTIITMRYSFYLVIVVLLWGSSLKKADKVVIGWREFVSIPELGIDTIKVKVDTGARTSALHVTNLHIKKTKKGQYAEFTVHPKQRSSLPKVANRKRIYSFKDIKSSNGHISSRPVIMIKVLIGNIAKEIELTLVDRDLMGFRMLLGRTALKGSFIVDPSKSFLVSKERSRKSQK